MPEKRIIFDFGSNNGDDIPYYLMKADVVVAVEANPVLVDQICSRFAEAIEGGRLVVEACALTIEKSAASVPFYVHKSNHVLSQFLRPDDHHIAAFNEIAVQSKNVIDLISQYGSPYYVKVDIENYDHLLLKSLFEGGVFPPYISAESHTIEVFALLIALGGYRAFKLVDGRSVPQRYRDVLVKTADGEIKYSFPMHSAGPFGEDVAGPWMTPNNFFRVLSFAGLGWKDIHASRVDPPDPKHAPQPQFQIRIDY